MSEVDKSNIIFDLTDSTNNYRGVLFAEVDFESMDGMPMPKDFCAGVMAIIWTDKEGCWFLTARIKFPSGSKQIIKQEGGKDCNETKLLQALYKFPMKNKTWTRNPCGSPDGIIKIMEDLDMIEYLRSASK